MKILALLLILLSIVSCTGPISYSDTVYAPTSPAQIEVVHLNQLQRPYEIIGECRGDPLFQSARDLKKMAGKLGANAISIPVSDGQFLTSQAIRWK